MCNLDKFQEALSARMSDAHGAAGIPEPAIYTLTDRLQEEAKPGAGARTRNPLQSVFDDAMENALRAADRDSDLSLLHGLRDVAKDLDWFKRPSKSGTAFHEGHANAEIIGRRGALEIDGVTVGLTVMRPDTVYPDHHHPPEEVYLVLSKGHWRQKDGPWHEPGYGGYVYNPPDIVHAMRSGDQPLLAIWCLNHAEA